MTRCNLQALIEINKIETEIKTIGIREAMEANSRETVYMWKKRAYSSQVLGQSKEQGQPARLVHGQGT